MSYFSLLFHSQFQLQPAFKDNFFDGKIEGKNMRRVQSYLTKERLFLGISLFGGLLLSIVAGLSLVKIKIR
jgi:hypothetical protein